MGKTSYPPLAPVECIEQRILLIRGQKVILDRDLANLYGVQVGYLKRQVRRNIERFPPDFLLELSREEYDSLRCQFGTLLLCCPVCSEVKRQSRSISS
ncbi:MAG: ORF6N domain-containing protein [bacterium]